MKICVLNFSLEALSPFSDAKVVPFHTLTKQNPLFFPLSLLILDIRQHRHVILSVLSPLMAKMAQNYALQHIFPSFWCFFLKNYAKGFVFSR